VKKVDFILLYSMKDNNLTEFTIARGQIKSLEKAKRIAYSLDILEVEAGIRVTKITMRDMFICPDIDIEKLNETPMERNVRDIIKQIT